MSKSAPVAEIEALINDVFVTYKKTLEGVKEQLEGVEDPSEKVKLMKSLADSARGLAQAYKVLRESNPEHTEDTPDDWLQTLKV